MVRQASLEQKQHLWRCGWATLDRAAMSASTGEYSSGASAARAHATERTHVSPDVTTGHMTPPTPSTVTLKEAPEAGECAEGEPCSPPKTKLNADWPQRPKPVRSPNTRMIPMRKARSPRTKLRRNLDSTVTKKAEVSAVMAKLKVRTDKCNTEVVTQAQKRLQNGDQ